MKSVGRILLAVLIVSSCVAPAPELPPSEPSAPETNTPDIAEVLAPPLPSDVFILGDSQLSFGLGANLVDFFERELRSCSGFADASPRTKARAIGVRSSSLHHWSATGGAEKGVICDIDARFGVNASSIGVRSNKVEFVQIGTDPDHAFCRPGRSVLGEVFSQNSPDLAVLAFLGNATQRWQSPADAQRDFDLAIANIPNDTQCMVMTTIPAFPSDINAQRLTAQSNLSAAVRRNGRCSFVPGITSKTRAAIEGQAEFFKTNAAGEVVDATHPTVQSSQRFVQLQKSALCDAVLATLK